LAASFLMGTLHALVQKASPPKKQDEEDSTEKAAAAVSTKVFDHRLTRREKKTAGPVVHYLFGTAVGPFTASLPRPFPPFARDSDRSSAWRCG
jgi:hypothetical protein